MSRPKLGQWCVYILKIVHGFSLFFSPTHTIFPGLLIHTVDRTKQEHSLRLFCQLQKSCTINSTLELGYLRLSKRGCRASGDVKDTSCLPLHELVFKNKFGFYTEFMQR